MKKLLLLIVILFSVSYSFAQEEQLSEKEKARREKNIQAGNPFARFGYKAKVATLSKGKYLEFHDLDSIVKIGSFSYHVKRKVVTGFTKYDTVYPESTLRPEIVSRWLSPDPLSEEFPSWSPYNFTLNNPIRFVDPDGREPIKPYVGTAAVFISLLNNSPSKVGTYKGVSAKKYLLKLGNTKWNWKQMRPLPTQTGYFNMKKGRYIYTKKGGWLDMTHFMFYAGKAYKYKNDGHKNPIGEAVQDGYKQEASDAFSAKHSAYSYEDLPTDKFGAEFAVNHFDPNSDKTFGEQLNNYLTNVLEATSPENAPNFNDLPLTDSNKVPSRTNNTTSPLYIEGDKGKSGFKNIIPKNTGKFKPWENKL